MRISILALGLVAAGCEERKPATKTKPVEAAPDRWFAEPDEVSAALASARKKVEVELRGAHLVRLTGVGIDPEGRLHPRFGSVELEFQREFDPDLPIGAPLSAHAEKTCLVLARGPDGWTGHTSCGPKRDGAPPTCTTRTIWKRALREGAPTGAIAAISFESDRWRFEIDDPRARVLTFFPDDCAPEQIAEARVEVGEDFEYTLTSSGAGQAICDELIRRTRCMYDKTPSATEARRAFDDGVKAWKEALENEATRDAVIEACQMSLDAGKEGFAALGC